MKLKYYKEAIKNYIPLVKDAGWNYKIGEYGCGLAIIHPERDTGYHVVSAFDSFIIDKKELIKVLTDES